MSQDNVEVNWANYLVNQRSLAGARDGGAGRGRGTRARGAAQRGARATRARERGGRGSEREIQTMVR
ncbi:hypothetical protein SBA1_410001 [Candidatus Sulfotelmatobacter kueseliae]|uniref:Uncharacterized protein n=1 Tax=Candidatus Sulfotelmatobacter kueseliae TaxID=2042962 RepID=A0A2U3KQK3_9BACT|nr:hypothetical protein SBA1_410001 [Candidatus Sulfotelmatobacter kueseliae]